ncbi:MAG: hypothetical protein ACTHOC_02760 [Luteimonas sp.]
MTDTTAAGAADALAARATGAGGNHARRAAQLAGLWLLALLGQCWLIANPGYFSHDELQWAAFAGQAGPIPWVSWTDVATFQYRPLTFNLWLWLSRHLFAHPHAFHLLLVAWGSANAALLFAIARRLGLAALPAAAGALAFALGPDATYVHGWVGTLADLAWLSCALVVALVAVSCRRAVAVAAVAAALTLAALLAKEAAVSIPALLAVGWWCLPARRRSLGAATIASGLVVLAYLAVRAGALLHAPRTGAQYDPALAHVPVRWLEYQLFTLRPSVFETFNTLAPGLHASMLLAALAWLLLVAAVWRSDRRLAVLFLLGGVAALAPVLPLASSFNQYGYGFAAVTAMAVAAAWPRARPWARAVIAFAGLACVAHGIMVMRMVRHIGDVQARFSPALAAALESRDTPLRLRPEPGAEDWIFQRLTFDVPSYAGVPIGDRVQLVAGDEPADATVRADGTIVPR